MVLQAQLEFSSESEWNQLPSCDGIAIQNRHTMTMTQCLFFLGATLNPPAYSSIFIRPTLTVHRMDLSENWVPHGTCDHPVPY